MLVSCAAHRLVDAEEVPDHTDRIFGTHSQGRGSRLALEGLRSYEALVRHAVENDGPGMTF
jgi:hypothetical protein